MAKKASPNTPTGGIIIGDKIKDIPDDHVVIDLNALNFLDDIVVLGPNAKGVMVALFQLPKRCTVNTWRENLEFMKQKIDKLKA